MALPPATSWLLISLLAVTTAPSTCEETESVRIADAGGLLQCYPAPALTNATNGTAFRATLLPLLGSLPSAAAHTGFASLHSAARGQRAFARGLCFGNSTAPSECARCLSAAVGNLTAGCGATSRRAGIWSDRCFLAYADTNASSPSEDAFLARVLLPGDDAVHVPASEPNTKSFYYAHLHKELVAMARQVARRAAANISGPRILATADKTKYKGAVSRTVHVLAQCGRDRTAADCVRCLRDSAQAVDWELHAARGDGGVAAAVVGFTCYLRFEVSTAVGGDSIDARPKKDRATWTNGRTGFLVSMMKEYSDVGKYRAQNGWTKEGWQAMKNRLNERPPGANFTVQQLKDREQRLKKELNVVKSIVEKSGFGWDPELKVPTAIDEKWAELSSEQRKWRHKQFPYYDVLYGIYEGVLAMFFCAFGA